MATNDGYGKHVKWRAFEDCPNCGYVDLAPGVLSDDGYTEIRTCDDCGANIVTKPYFTRPLSEAETTDLG